MNILNFSKLPQVKRQNLYNQSSEYIASIALPDGKDKEDLIAITNTLDYLKKLSRTERLSRKGLHAHQRATQ